LLHSPSGYWQTKVLRREDPYLKVGEVNDRAHKGASERRTDNKKLHSPS
jgi:lipopolysaccharide transport system ATP-binding protein